jgi:thymidylate synthase
MTEFDRQYVRCLQDILENGFEELNERTGRKVKAMPGVHFRISGGFPLLTLRRIPIQVFVAEQIWFLMGSRKPAEFLSQHTKIWEDFTNLNGVVSTAYGYRWRHHFGRDQITLLTEMLEKEPSSRHGVVVAWDPGGDGLGAGRKKNVPCPFAFTVNIIGNQLHLHNFVRSNDMVLGCPHDVAGFALLQHILAAHLGVEVGVYSHSIANAHIYDVHYEAARELTNRVGQDEEIQLVADRSWLRRAESGDEAVLREIADMLKPQYKPDPPIRSLAVVL